MAMTVAGMVGLGAVGAGTTYSVHQANAAAAADAGYASKQALQTLNSFYKPALKGQFPGAVSGLTVGKSTRQDVLHKIGEPENPMKDADGFDVYSANMGNPGYAIHYKLGKIREMRYFGTNVERQTNIGGITMKMLKQNWYAPSSVSTFKTGNKTQTKLTYNRGNYKLEFIFNSATELDHINLLTK
ncbi:hypothetical protein BGX30_003340 [Mortierella sp. GBA39]|nr:hypothetical protein BGX30_003340 [Mortierella sp. GBA39]